MTLSNVNKYRAKPITIEALRWTGKNWDELDQFLGHFTKEALKITDYVFCMRVFERGTHRFYLKDESWPLTEDSVLALSIKVNGRQVPAERGDFIVKGVTGEFYPCKPEIFEAMYTLQEFEPCPACGEHENIRVTEFSADFGGEKHSYCGTCSERGPAVGPGEDVIAAWDKWAIERKETKNG